MATIENRSRTYVTVKGRADLTKYFPHNKNDLARAYREELVRTGLKPVVKVLDEAYSIRYQVNGKRKSFNAKSEKEAVAIAQRLESEHHHGLFVDYSAAHRVSLADLLIRYLKEEAPRTKSFLVTAYQINNFLSSAGLPRQDVAEIHKQHSNPQNRSLHIPAPTGRRMSQACDAASFIRTAFAKLEPDDFNTYIDERMQVVQPGTVDREMDVLRTVCSFAINTWRIPVQIHPMAGVRSPKYYNERDRRLVGDEYDRLMVAAIGDDRERAIEARMRELLASESPPPANTKYQHLKRIAELRGEAETTFLHVAWFETFIEFQLMAGARRGETLSLRWSHINLDEQTAFLPETKNGRARTVPLRSDLVALLRELPRDSEDEHVFRFSIPQLRKAWARICSAANIPTEGDNVLHIHDLRHEAISRVAEASSNTPGGFTLADLQAFSGHQDVRMLMRYTSLMPKALARRLDAAFSNVDQHSTHKGRIRLTRKSKVTVAEVVNTQPNTLGTEIEDTPEQATMNGRANDVAYATGHDHGTVVHVAFPKHGRFAAGEHLAFQAGSAS